MDRTIERAAMVKVYWRLLPLTAVVYFLCYLDRINISFAALEMNRNLGLTASVYGISSTAFYIGYCLFEVPSNIVLDKVGARLWIARIMITWGLISGATAFAVGPRSFMAIRFLLGAAEAGLFPGILLLFTYWFPDRHRARIVSSFTLALPISVALGAPISTATRKATSRAARTSGSSVCNSASGKALRTCSRSAATSERRPRTCSQRSSTTRS